MLARLRLALPPHLLPSLAAMLSAAIWLTSLEVRADARLKRFAPALASLNLPEAARGVVLQGRIFARPDCLPIYGSSELGVDQPTRADRFFRRKRQGFDAFVFGQPGDRCLMMAQELASLGDAARGRNVAVFLSPVWFLPPPAGGRRDHDAHKQFAAVFSLGHAARLAVDSPLDVDLKRRIATRLLDYEPVIQAQSPLVALALEQMRSGSRLRRFGSAALRPLLKLQEEILVLQERRYWVEVSRNPAFMRRTSGLFNSRRKHLDWEQLEQDVDHSETKHDLLALYSRGPAAATELPPARRIGALVDGDADFLRRMNASPEWADLALLLGVAKEMGVHLLLVGQPINGLFSDDEGITAAARRVYYQRLSQTAARYRAPLRDFSAFEEDRAFFMDLVHPSAEAWVHYDEVLAQFFRPERH